MAISIGTSTWTRLKVGADPLSFYSRSYTMVEVDSTFHNIPSEKILNSWRDKVSSDFQFIVKANKIISHDEEMADTDLSRLAMDRTNLVARRLGATGIIITPPPSLYGTDGVAEGFLSLYNRVQPPCPVYLDLRGGCSRNFWDIFEDVDVYTVWDPLSLDLGVEGTEPYLRILGPDPSRPYQADDNEIERINEILVELENATVVFHGPTMYRDAARLMLHMKHGEHSPVTGTTGIDSIIEVFNELEMPFPMLKKDIVSRVGQLCFDLDKGIVARFEEYVHQLDDRIYNNMNEVKLAFSRILSGGNDV